MIFASLQYSRKQVVDPMALVEALNLDKGNQQDAAE
jgi:ubiquitin carboxyl-terminal hydrolase 48